MTKDLPPALGAAILAFIGVVGVLEPLQAQESEADTSAASSTWHWATTIDIKSGFDTNVFLLDPGKKNDLAAPSGPDRVSGRFANMESTSDLITILQVAGGLKGRGVLDRWLTFAPEIQYDLYARNAERSHLRLGLAIDQELPKGGRIGVSGQFTPSYFSKNYLADATDLDASGTISPDERLYRAGIYSEGDVSLKYRARLAKATRAHPLGAKLELGMGYYHRGYDPPFRGRDLAGPKAAAGLLFDLRRRGSLDVAYEISALRAAVTPEVLLLNEPDFNVDFNSDGSPDDFSVRTVQAVDRSRIEHSLGMKLDVDMSSATQLSLSYEYRLRDVTSEQPFDVADRGRRDTRNSVGADIRLRVAQGLRLALGGELASQKTNRSGDPASTGEIDDYTRVRTALRLIYRL